MTSIKALLYCIGLFTLVQAIQTAFAARKNYQVDLRKLAKLIDPQTGQPYGLITAAKLAGVP